MTEPRDTISLLSMAEVRRRAMLGLLGASLLSVACGEEHPDVRVDLGRRRTGLEHIAGPDLRFAVGTMISPRETLQDYLALTDYVQQRIGRPVRLLQRRGYAETNDLLVRGDVDFGFICAGPYSAIRHSGVSLLAVPVVDGSPTFRSLIVVRNDDPARTIPDLRGSSFAFVDPLSFTGRIYPEALIQALSPDGGAFFSSTVFTHSHSDSLVMVEEARVRAAAVENIAFEYLRRRDPQRISHLRILHESPPFSGPPFVARVGLPPDVARQLQAALLEMHESQSGRAILASLGFARFVPIDDSAYDEVARLRQVVVGENAEFGR